MMQVRSLSYSITNDVGVTFEDWFLPSLDELKLMYDNIKVRGLGNFITKAFNEYWSSSEYNEYAAISLHVRVS